MDWSASLQSMLHCMCRTAFTLQAPAPSGPVDKCEPPELVCPLPSQRRNMYYFDPVCLFAELNFCLFNAGGCTRRLPAQSARRSVAGTAPLHKSFRWDSRQGCMRGAGLDAQPCQTGDCLAGLGGGPSPATQGLFHLVNYSQSPPRSCRGTL